MKSLFYIFLQIVISTLFLVVLYYISPSFLKLPVGWVIVIGFLTYFSLKEHKHLVPGILIRYLIKLRSFNRAEERSSKFMMYFLLIGFALIILLIDMDSAILIYRRRHVESSIIKFAVHFYLMLYLCTALHDNLTSEKDDPVKKSPPGRVIYE
jgi:hypothetical protein